MDVTRGAGKCLLRGSSFGGEEVEEAADPESAARKEGWKEERKEGKTS